MGRNDHILYTNEEAELIAIKARAITRCKDHEEVLLDNYDSEAVSRAYAMGTAHWKKGGLDCSREEFMDSIKAVIEGSADECFTCTKMRDE